MVDFYLILFSWLSFLNIKIDIAPSLNVISNQNPDTWDFMIWFSIYVKLWDALFSRQHVNNGPKSYIFIIKNYRNQWAHNHKFTLRDALRIIDTIQVFLEEIQGPIDEINTLRLTILEKLYFEEINRYHGSVSKDSTNNEMVILGSKSKNLEFYARCFSESACFDT